MDSNQFDPTSLTLLERVRRRNSDAWDHLVELYAPLVYYWCRRASLTTDDSADVFQEVFQAVSLHIGEFRKDHESHTFRGWLRTITTNKICDHFRRSSKQPIAQGGTDAQLQLQSAPDLLEIVDEQEEESVVRQSLWKALDWIQHDFTSQTWQAFWGSYMDSRATDEIAEELGMSTAAVRKAKYRVIRRLREQLSGLIDF